MDLCVGRGRIMAPPMIKTTEQQRPDHGTLASHCVAAITPEPGQYCRPIHSRAPMAIPQERNQRWSLDFVSDAFACGRRFRIVAVVDDFTRECVRLIADTSISGMRVARELDLAMAERSCPALIDSDNGTEFTSMAILRWSKERDVEWHYITPGKPQQNGFIESFKPASGTSA